METATKRTSVTFLCVCTTKEYVEHGGCYTNITIIMGELPLRKSKALNQCFPMKKIESGKKRGFLKWKIELPDGTSSLCKICGKNVKKSVRLNGSTRLARSGIRVAELVSLISNRFK